MIEKLASSTLRLSSSSKCQTRIQFLKVLWEFEKVVGRHVNRQETLYTEEEKKRPFQKPDSRKLEEIVMGHTNHQHDFNNYKMRGYKYR